MAGPDRFHIIVFTDTFFETNGVGSYYRTLLSWFRRQNDIGVTIICPSREDLETSHAAPDVVPVSPTVNFRNPFYRDLMVGYYSRWSLRRIVSTVAGPNVIHIATSGPLGFAGASVARQLRLPAVGCYHTDMGYYARIYGQNVLGRPGGWIGAKAALICDRLAYGRCDSLFVPSETAAKTVRGFYRREVRVIPNPIDTNRFQPATSREGDFRNRYGGEGKALVTVVGRIAREKNLDLVCQLLGGDPRINLVFVGGGPYANELRERWNVCVTGFLHGRRLLEAYQQSDLLVQLSLSETFGLSLVEALACGLPAVVLRSPGFVDTIPPRSGVEVLEVDELKFLGDRCVNLVRDADRHREQSRRARELVLPLGVDAVLPRFVDYHRSTFPLEVLHPFRPLLLPPTGSVPATTPAAAS